MTPQPDFRERVEWLGPVRCHDISREELIRELVRSGDRGAPPRLFFNLNAHALNLALKNSAFAAALNRAEVTFCDGFGVLLLARIFGDGRLRHRMTPPDFVQEIYRRFHEDGKRIFLVGDEPANVETYARSVEAKFPKLIAGWHDGFFEPGSSAESALIEKIRAEKPHLLLLGMGMPRQELWADVHQERLFCKGILTVGALFSWGISTRRRGPRWATDRGLEWLFRLFLEPSRVWKRYLIGLPEVVFRLLLASRRD
jgi:N-acetylglucosaminyldiphosphoundecaprenol N-acetyl-beta-D-mannosaminyltransferase